MKKICFITPNVFPVPAVKGGAVETLVEEIISENEKSNKLEITCFSSYDKKAFEESKKYKSTKFIFTKNLENKFLKFIFRCINHISFKVFNYDIASNRYNKIIYKNICDKEFDYIIVEGGAPLEYENLIHKIKEKKETKILFHIHGLNKGTEKLNELYDGFISISKYVTNNFLKNKIVSESKVYTVNNGIDINLFSQEIDNEEKNELRKKYNIKENEIVIMFCGRLIQEKGIKELILALKQVKNIDKCKLLIVGNSQFANNAKTKYELELKNIAEELKDKIVFTGFINNKELYKIHRISDISVIPSIWEEPFGLVVLEAMCSGLPIITTNSGAIPEIVTNECAYILERDDKLVENMAQKIDYLIEDKEKIKEMGSFGKNIVKQYSLENMYQNFCNIL